MGELSTFWQRHRATIDPERFRASPQFLDVTGYDHAGVWASFDSGRRRLATALGEDGAFGAETVELDGVTVSRDLLDSVQELFFLGASLDLSRLRIVDIGAGYGRFAHRVLQAFPKALVSTIDPLPEAEAACRRYLKHRGLGTGPCGPARILSTGMGVGMHSADLAVNIHSWSECDFDMVAWWVHWLAERRVPRLFIVPHFVGAAYQTALSRLGTWSDDLGGGMGPSYLPALEAVGYRVLAFDEGPPCQPQPRFLFALEGT